jgi:hypothetical protein
MKLILALTVLLSTQAFARQYIQCRVADLDSTDVMVVNLQDPGKQSTLFISSGMQNPEDERMLLNIEFTRIDNNHHIFKIVNEEGKGNVAVPTEVIGKNSDFFKVDLNFAEYSFEYICFSRLYNDQE